MTEFRSDWLSKSVAGSVFGFTLAIAVAGLFAVAGPGGLEARNKYQFVMWLVAPIWLCVASLVFFFRSGRAALLWLGGANLLAFGGLYLCRRLLH
ncbi:hypothetical protein [Methylosinus sp. Sm6]|uniref:hypothetical protein n=1 Tax=Methylosinus sp. Sm6 TaxID=2866948 RepID=UPI001C997204|nr:hypothetical protein [Methylosinus sp. Sm6]MBY6240087.1 hypothetical protein [Methylosinus sp. Sm6]